MWNPFARKKAPQSPAFPVTMDEAEDIFVAYLRNEVPMDFFFEFRVMEIIGALPEPTVSAIDSLGADVFEDSDWRTAVCEDLELSETFDIAVLDLWYRNVDILAARGEDYHPWEFARDFEDQYFADDSLVDVWPDGALDEAKARIAERRG